MANELTDPQSRRERIEELRRAWPVQYQTVFTELADAYERIDALEHYLSLALEEHDT